MRYPAKADLIFNLTQDNVGGPAPYAQVDVQRTSQSTATITFDQLGQYYLMDGGSAALNINGGFAIGTITGTAALGATRQPIPAVAPATKTDWQLQLES